MAQETSPSSSNSYESANFVDRQAELYNRGGREDPIRLLIYRNLKRLLRDMPGNKALDYGSGTGISTNALKKMDLDVIGVDINPSMVDAASKNYPDVKFMALEEPGLPYHDNSFDLVFSSLVLFELSDKVKLRQYLDEAYRVLRPGGRIVATTGSEELHNPARNWAEFDSKFPENNDRFSGKKVKVHVKEMDVTFDDFFWTTEDYFESFTAAGFEKFEHFPTLGMEEDHINWQDELTHSPFVIFTSYKPA